MPFTDNLYATVNPTTVFRHPAPQPTESPDITALISSQGQPQFTVDASILGTRPGPSVAATHYRITSFVMPYRLPDITPLLYGRESVAAKAIDVQHNVWQSIRVKTTVMPPKQQTGEGWLYPGQQVPIPGTVPPDIDLVHIVIAVRTALAAQVVSVRPPVDKTIELIFEKPQPSASIEPNRLAAIIAANVSPAIQPRQSTDRTPLILHEPYFPPDAASSQAIFVAIRRALEPFWYPYQKARPDESAVLPQGVKPPIEAPLSVQTINLINRLNRPAVPLPFRLPDISGQLPQGIPPPAESTVSISLLRQIVVSAFPATQPPRQAPDISSVLPQGTKPQPVGADPSALVSTYLRTVPVPQAPRQAIPLDVQLLVDRLDAYDIGFPIPVQQLIRVILQSYPRVPSPRQLVLQPELVVAPRPPVNGRMIRLFMTQSVMILRVNVEDGQVITTDPGG